VLAAAYAGTSRPRFRAAALPARGPVRHLEIGLPDGSTDRVAWSAGLALPIDDAQPFTTDGKLVWLRTNTAGNPSKWFTLDGRYLMYGVRSLLG
jgi:hypothetical protein